MKPQPDKGQQRLAFFWSSKATASESEKLIEVDATDSSVSTSTSSAATTTGTDFTVCGYALFLFGSQDSQS